MQQGGEIPREYYLKGTAHSDGQKTTKATINHSDTLQLAYDVSMSGSVIKYVIIYFHFTSSKYS